MSKIKLALICTIGGHFEQLTNLSDFYKKYDHFWITNKNQQTENALKVDKKYFVEMAHFKKPWLYMMQIPKFLFVFFKEKPTHIISTGSGRTAFIPFLFSKFFKIKFIYIDTFSRVNGYSKFGTFVTKLGYPLCTQWNNDESNNITYIGPIFKHTDQYPKKRARKNYIFVTLGTRIEPFLRLIKAVEKLIETKVIKEKVYIQAGYTEYDSTQLQIFDFCSPKDIDEYIINAKYVITQESAGIGTKCLKYNTKFIVMPRDYAFRELPTKSDMKEDLHLKLAELGYTRVVNNENELKTAIQEIDKIKIGYTFDNRLAISKLRELVEG